MPRVALAALVAALGCTRTEYAYTFELRSRTADDANVKTEVSVDAAAHAVRLGVTNATDAVVQVEWTEIALTRPDGAVVALRPDADLGWIEPGSHVTARLFPFALPSDDAAVAYEGRAFRIDVPAIVHRDRKLYRFELVAHVRKL